MTTDATPDPNTASQTWPQIRPVGVDGLLVSFADALDEAANRAALALRDDISRQNWPGVEELSTSLVSTYIRFDVITTDRAVLYQALTDLLHSRDWTKQPPPQNRRLWRIPAVFGTDLAPQLPQAAAAAGLSETEARAQLAAARVRVQAIGFAPGQPYLGQLPEAWNIPRQSQLTSQIPVGALAVAIRQLVLFSVTTPTGWMHVGQTAVRLFQPDAENPFLLRAGDEVMFQEVTPEQLTNMKTDPFGGATSEVLR
ncbi:carboxyltransferase domain-containing protein [Phaeobacter sp.]|uniref:5-oxoprolinase subunit B family protein n=1 Tax=Phaeobacter sp. TaxID=1902409 RepID=UPI0025D93D48|nr:carboxyltransferase domain-containing protein [Phaeobacter sp.]